MASGNRGDSGQPAGDDLPGAAVSRQRRLHTSGPSWRTVLMYSISLLVAVALFLIVWRFIRPLALLFAAIVIAETLAPLVAWLEQWLPRIVAVITAYLVVVLVLSGIGWIVVPPMIDQVDQVIENAPALIERGQELISRWNPTSNERLIDVVMSQLSSFGDALAGLPVAIVSAASELFFVLFMSIYWLIFTPAIHRFVLSLVPTADRPGATALLSDLGRTVGGYIRAATINGAIVGLLTYIGLSIIGVDYALALALVAGVLELIPVVGPVVATIPIVGFALLDSPIKAAITLAFWVGMEQVENQVLVPNIMRSQTDIPPPLILFALFAGGSVGGILGALIAIPLAGALKVIVLQVIAPAIRRWTGAEPEVTEEPPAGESPEVKPREPVETAR